MSINNVKYWQGKYLENSTKWDLGAVSPPLKIYFDGLSNKELKILIPGAGNAHEAEYLHEIGFNNVFIAEWAPKAIADFKNRLPSFPTENIIEGDFFEIQDSFDLIVEQTFFCALTPDLRTKYVDKVHSLLTTDALFIGLFFNVTFEKGPPFGGNEEEYRTLFASKFHISKMEKALNSIAPRQGSELFFEMKAI